eukprot:741892-Prorocentrum_minimum.AAC.2
MRTIKRLRRRKHFQKFKFGQYREFIGPFLANEIRSGYKSLAIPPLADNVFRPHIQNQDDSLPQPSISTRRLSPWRCFLLEGYRLRGRRSNAPGALRLVAAIEWWGARDCRIGPLASSQASAPCDE